MPTSVPKAPSLRVTSYTDTTINVNADTTGNGGLPADQVQLGYGTSPTTPSKYLTLNLATGVGQVIALLRGETYYLRVREHNAKGWSKWSISYKVRMKSGPSKMPAPLITNVTQQTVYFRMSPNFDGNSPITGYRIGYGLDPAAPTDYIEWLSNVTRGVYHLQPGKTYYFWAQAKNAYGAGILSPRVSAFIQVGATVRVNGVYKRALPFVRVSGVYKQAQPWVKHGGVWKETK